MTHEVAEIERQELSIPALAVMTRAKAAEQMPELVPSESEESGSEDLANLEDLQGATKEAMKTVKEMELEELGDPGVDSELPYPVEGLYPDLEDEDKED